MFSPSETNNSKSSHAFKIPPNPINKFGPEFLKEHQKHIYLATTDLKEIRAEMEKLRQENLIFVESCVRPILSKEHLKKNPEVVNRIENFLSRGHFVLLKHSVKKFIVEILTWATRPFDELPDIVHYVLLGLDLLLNDRKFAVLSEKVQIHALQIQYKDLYLFSARRILFKIWERNFLNLNDKEQVETLKEAVSLAQTDKSEYKKMDISKEYVFDLIKKCEYLHAKGEKVIEHVYDLLNSNLSLWHKYHIAKAVSSPLFAEMKATDTHYSDLLNTMKNSIDIAIKSSRIGKTGISAQGTELSLSNSFLLHDNDADSDDFIEDHTTEELINEYVNDLILAQAPPYYIAQLSQTIKSDLIHIVESFLKLQHDRDLVESLMNMIAHPGFSNNIQEQTQLRLLGCVKNILKQTSDLSEIESALHNLILFVCHPALSSLAQQDKNWLILQAHRLKVNFRNASEVQALIEFLEDFNKIPKDAELTTLYFYLGRLWGKAENAAEDSRAVV